MLGRKESALLVIDVQGRLHEIMSDREQLDRSLIQLINGAKLLDMPIIVTEQLPEKLGRTNQPFRALLEDVAVIEKSTFSCCGEPAFMEQLRQIKKRQLLLVGIETHVCIYQTAMDLLGEGYDVVVAADAVSSRSSENKRLALDALRSAGATILPAESILFALLKDAADPRFRDLLGLIK